MLIDSHCHLDYFENNLDQILDAAKAVGVEYFLSVGVNPKNVPARLQIGSVEISDTSAVIIAGAVGVSFISIIGLVLSGIL